MDEHVSAYFCLEQKIRKSINFLYVATYICLNITLYYMNIYVCMCMNVLYQGMNMYVYSWYDMHTTKK